MSRVISCVIGLLASAIAHGAPFTDPTRPPRELELPGDSASAAAAGAPRLESVLIAPDRRIAVINGTQYTEGGAFGEVRVLRITESEVVIHRGGREEVLKLFPQSGKRANAAAGGGK
jgi:hypothetical protein